MAAGQVQNPVPEANPITAEEVAIQAFIPLVKWCETSLRSWESAQVEVCIGEGSGQYASPFSITPKGFTEKCLCFGFSLKLLQRLQEHASLFEHVFHFPEHSRVVTSSSQVDMPTHLEIFMAAYE